MITISIDAKLDQHDLSGYVVLAILTIGKTLDIIFCGGKMLDTVFCLGLVTATFAYITGSNIVGGK
jgi:hypothetical protein